MKLQYQLFQKDLNAFATAHFLQHITIPKKIVFMFSTLIILYIFATSITENGLDSLIILGVLGIIFPLTIFLRKKLFPQPDDHFDDYAMTLSDENLFIEGNNGVSQYEWRQILQMKESTKYIFLYVKMNQAVIVPKRAFAAVEALDHFRNWVGARIH